MKNKGIKTYLESVHFDFEADEEMPLGPHIHYTTGAASLMDEAFLFKSKDKDLTDKEKDILKNIKSDKTKTKKEETMSEEIVKTLEDKVTKLEKQLSISDTTNMIKEFKFEKEVEIAKALSILEDEPKELIVSVFKSLIEEKEEAIKKSKKDEPNPLADALEEDVEGDEDITKKQDIDTDGPVKKSFAQRYKDHKEAQKENK